MKLYVIFILSFLSWSLLAKPSIKDQKELLTQQHFITVSNSSLANEQAIKSSKQSSNEYLDKELTELSKYDSTDNGKETSEIDLNASESANNSKPLESNSAKLSNEIQSLSQFFTNNSTLKIHNKALEMLKNKDKIPAILL
ncbi:MAG: hypothetical protein OXN83_04920, partial [Oligoflexia bacterium]|nr:hypothetical protein [Oligoflexia bacterium]